MHTKTIKRIHKGLKELQINNKFRKPYQLIIHPSFFNGKMRSYDIINKLFGAPKLLITECTYKHFKDSFITHCEIRNCKKDCRFFKNKFSKKLVELPDIISNKGLTHSISEHKDTTHTCEKIDALTPGISQANGTAICELTDEKDINRAIHNCIKSILRKRNKFRYIIVCSDIEIINDLLKLPRVPILEIFGMNISLNLSNMNSKKNKEKDL